MSSFENKVVIVTGCSSGIGLAATQLFLARKAKVFGIDISPFRQEIDSSAFSFHQVDLTTPNAATEAVAACVEKYGPKIDVLANVAGIMDLFASADTVKEADWERVMSINLTAPVRLMTAVLPSMKEHKGGAIVNVASRAAQSGAISGVAYAASKHGLVGATKNVAWRFHNEGIRCNAVLPGGVATNIQSTMQPDKMDVEAYMNSAAVIGLHTPMNAEGVQTVTITAEDIGHTIVFLASDEAKMVNGALVPVDNAWSTI